MYIYIYIIIYIFTYAHIYTLFESLVYTQTI